MPKLGGFGYFAIICFLVLVIGIYFAAFYRTTDDLVWTDVKYILVQENAKDLKELCYKINQLNVPDRRKVRYENITTVDNVDYEIMLKEAEHGIYIKPGFTVKNIKKRYMKGSSYPTFLEGVINIFNDVALVVIFLDDDERIVGWEFSDKINMKP